MYDATMQYCPGFADFLVRNHLRQRRKTRYYPARRAIRCFPREVLEWKIFYGTFRGGLSVERMEFRFDLLNSRSIEKVCARHPSAGTACTCDYGRSGNSSNASPNNSSATVEESKNPWNSEPASFLRRRYTTTAEMVTPASRPNKIYFFITPLVELTINIIICSLRFKSLASKKRFFLPRKIVWVSGSSVEDKSKDSEE